MFRLNLIICALILLLAGCGQAPVAPTLNRQMTLQTKEALEFRQISVSELAAGRAQKDGKLVTFEASFDRHLYSTKYGESRQGYKLWDHDGNWVLCENIYAESSLWDRIEGINYEKDFNDQTKSWILNYGTFVKIEGAYHAGVAGQPSRVDVYFINGIPVKEFVAK